MANPSVSERPSKLLAEWFWTDRWIGSSAFLLPLEPRGLYREMLTQAWRRGGRLPNDPEAIRRAVGCTVAEWRRCWPKVEGYWRVDGDSLINDTQVDVIAQTIAAHERAVERGRKGGKASAQSRAQVQEQVEAQVQEQVVERVELKCKPPDPSPDPSTLERSPACELTRGASTDRTRAGDFCEWYAETHYRLFGIGYIGNPQKDYARALELVGVFSDDELRDAATFWFGQKDRFATDGTRTITKFASRVSDIVRQLRQMGVAS